jgi:hypothetical protein
MKEPNDVLRRVVVQRAANGNDRDWEKACLLMEKSIRLGAVFLHIFTGDKIKLILVTKILSLLCPMVIGLDGYRWWKSSLHS